MRVRRAWKCAAIMSHCDEVLIYFQIAKYFGSNLARLLIPQLVETMGDTYLNIFDLDGCLLSGGLFLQSFFQCGNMVICVNALSQQHARSI